MRLIQANRTNYKGYQKIKGLNLKQTIFLIRSAIIMVTVMLLIGSNAVQTTMAAEFNPTFRENLKDVCVRGLFQAGSNLNQVCANLYPPGMVPLGGPVNSLAIVASPEGTGTVGRRLQSPLISKEEKLQDELGRRAYTMNTSEQFVQGDALQLPPAGGTSPDLVFGLGSGTSVFLSAGAYALNHYNNRYEDGYEAQLPTVTVGADHRVNDWMLAGLAFNYTNYDGTYDDGGGFDKNIFGPLLYAAFLPFEGAFANVVLGYARQENRNNRLASASSCANPGQPGMACNGQEQRISKGHTSADYSENQYTAGILAGYDQPFGNLTIGPRIGLAFSHEDFDSIKEEGDTGLELRYNNLNQTSVQSSLGVQASVGFETAYGIVVPQAAVAWVHEYANSDRNIDAQLVEATPAAPSFTFQREPPARDWASIGLGISALLPNGLQPFVQFATIQGNENFVSYGGTTGVRLGL